MRPRRRHPHSPRQVDVIFQPGGGVLLDSSVQTNTQQVNAGAQQRPSSVSPASGPATTELVQPEHHADPTTVSHSLSSAVNHAASLLSTSVARTSWPIAGHAATSTTGDSASSSLRPTKEPTSLGNFFSASSHATATSSASHSSGLASATPHNTSLSRSVELYGGIAFIAFFGLVCITSLTAWFLRSRRRRSLLCCGSMEDDDLGNKELGYGLGLHLDKHENKNDFCPQKLPSTIFWEPSHYTRRTNPSTPTFRGFTNSPGRSPTFAPRPRAAHLETENSVHSQSRLLGPLQVKNYASGDLTSSCDEGQPGSEPNTPRQMHAGSPLGLQGTQIGRNFSGPWAPLNVEASPAPRQVNISQSTSKASRTQAELGEKTCPLPMPPFEFTQHRQDCAIASPDGWGGTLRSSLCNAFSAIGATQKSEGHKGAATSLNAFQSDRWRDTFFPSRTAGCEADPSESRPINVPGSFVRPTTTEGVQTFDRSSHGRTSLKSIGLGLRIDERSSAENEQPMPPTVPLTLTKNYTSKSQNDRRPRSVKSRMSRTSSEYTSISRPARRSIKRTPRCSGRGGISSHPSLASRTRPEFPRQQTGASATSFSSESSEPSNELTGEELRAKRTMMLRARRKHGMGEFSGSGRRLTNEIARTRVRQPPERYDEESEGI